MLLLLVIHAIDAPGAKGAGIDGTAGCVRNRRIRQSAEWVGGKSAQKSFAPWVREAVFNSEIEGSN